MEEQRDDREVAEIEIGQIFSVVMIISVTVVGTAYMINVLSDVKSDFTAGSAEANATSAGITAVAKFPTKMTLVATIVVAVIIITLLTRYFRF